MGQSTLRYEAILRLFVIDLTCSAQVRDTDYEESWHQRLLDLLSSAPL